MTKERENFPFFLQRNNHAKQLAKFACFHSPGEKNQHIGLTNELLKNSQFKTGKQEKMHFQICDDMNAQ
jgi:hypothetical protein